MNTIKVKLIRLVNKLNSILAFIYLISNLALVRSRYTLPPVYVQFWSQPTIYRTELDSSEQALLTSHPPFWLTERRSGTVLFLDLCLRLFQASSHQWNKRNKHKHKHKKRKMFPFLVLILVLISPQCTLAFSCAYACAYACAYLTSVNQA